MQKTTLKKMRATSHGSEPVLTTKEQLSSYPGCSYKQSTGPFLLTLARHAACRAASRARRAVKSLGRPMLSLQRHRSSHSGSEWSGKRCRLH